MSRLADNYTADRSLLEQELNLKELSNKQIARAIRRRR